MEVRFTLKDQIKETVFTPVQNKKGEYLLYSGDTEDSQFFFLEKDDNGCFHLRDENPFTESDDVVNNRLVGLSEEWLEQSALGFESESESENPLLGTERPGYSPDEIFVENKPFSLRQIIELINEGDIELSPRFQRNFVWDNTRQSRLIESILLGLPLPSIFLSQYKDGRLTVVDGLQRLTTIKKFFSNELRLSNLEYLKECNGRSFNNVEEVLSPLRMRKFGQTQIMCFVIDYRSPTALKYDLFRRLNTGGKPLNNQEIRNCLSRHPLQNALYEMTHNPDFEAAAGGVQDTRLEAQELALRFIYFYEGFSAENPVGDYNGNIDITLDNFVENLNERTDFGNYINLFRQSLRAAHSLFGDYTFRKVYGHYRDVRKNQVNKVLMLCETVLLAKYSKAYSERIASGISLTDCLAEVFDNDDEFFQAVTYSTNARRNIEKVFVTLKTKVFDANLL